MNVQFPSRVDVCRNVEGENTPCVSNIPDIDIQDHTVPLADTYRGPNIRRLTLATIRGNPQAMVVLESTWLFKNLTKLLIDMSTPKR